MQNRKLKPSADPARYATIETPESPVTVADIGTTASIPSPALDLQASLQRQLEGATAVPPSSRSLPFGWTALGMIAFCTAFWTAVVYVLT